MKKTSVKNYLLIALFALVIIGVIFLSIYSGSVKYFGYFVLALAVLFVVAVFTQKTNHTNKRQFRSKAREQLLRDQYRK